MTEAATDTGRRALRHRPRIYNIPAGWPFLDTLARGIWEDAGGDKIALARATVLLPTRRACRSLREAFLRLTDGEPLLLPRLQPIGDIDDDEFFTTGDEADALDLPPAIDALERQLLLTRLILSRADVDRNPGVAARLAEALASFLDEVQIDEVSLDRLDDLVPAELAGHWQLTLDFLRIIREHWPRILAERQQMDPAERRIRMIRRLARRWGHTPPTDLVYAAGSTGSIPATAELLALVARLPTGKLILPGLDLDMDEACWRECFDDPTHPQHGLARLLDSIGAKRDEVRPWPGTEDPARRARAVLIANALRPASTTDTWRTLPPPPDEAFTGLRRIEAASPQEEAGAIALLMRETIETPGQTAALITPDRNLARRVVAELARWKVIVDDSAGTPLALTPAGIFFRLVAQVIADEVTPGSLLALLKHPLATGGKPRDDFIRRVRHLERRVLRGPRPAPGFKGVVTAVADSKDADDLLAWIEEIALAAAPLERHMSAANTPMADLLTAHVRFAEWLTTSETGEPGIWAGDAGEALADFVGDLRLAAPLLDGIAGRYWPSLLDALMSGRVVRPKFNRHPRLFIWGLLEARLQHADVLILGGLNEGTWPPEAKEDPWLSRPMRAALGLPSPERRIGLTAHDFAQAACAPVVVLTRASKVDGAPTLPSRWLLRLDALLNGDPRWTRTLANGYVEWHRRLDHPDTITPVPPPRPRPPVASRPRELSVTQIETWIRDPYAIYARHVLRLEPLEPIDADPGALDRGLMIHQALDMFVRDHPGPLPEDALQRLLTYGEEAFRPYMDRPAVRAFWWPRFRHIAAWFVELERKRRANGVRPAATEIAGTLQIETPTGPFTLRCKADRIDIGPDGGLIIIDYKTGQPPSAKQVASGLSPQLSLEAAIALNHGFEGIKGKTVTELTYMRLSGGAPAGEYRRLEPSRDGTALTPERLAAEALEGLKRRIAQFNLPETAYLSRPRPQWISRPGDYDHLARVKEWSGNGMDVT